MISINHFYIHYTINSIVKYNIIHPKKGNQAVANPLVIGDKIYFASLVPPPKIPFKFNTRQIELVFWISITYIENIMIMNLNDRQRLTALMHSPWLEHPFIYF